MSDNEKEEKKLASKEITMSAETAYVVFRTCLIKANIQEKNWAANLSFYLEERFEEKKPTPGSGYLRDNFNIILKQKNSSLPYPAVTFRTHFFRQLLEVADVDFIELESRFARPEPPPAYKLLIYKNNIPPLFKEYQPLDIMLWRLQMSLCNELYPVTAIFGMPGLGKTLLSSSYAATQYRRYPGGCWYMQAGSGFNFRDSMRELARDVWGMIFDENEKKDDELAWRKIKSHIEGPYTYNEKHKTLLIVDNVEIPSEEFSDFLIDKNKLNHVHILLTTRNPRPEVTKINWIAAEGLNTDEGRKLIGRFRQINTDEEPDVDQIVQRLGGFALALTIIGVILERNQDITFSDILTDMASGQIEYLNYSGENMADLPGHYEQRVISHLLMPLLAGLDEESLCILDYMTLLPPDQVAVPWIKELMEARFPHSFPETVYKTELSQWQKSIHHLKKLSLINETSSPKVVRMHRLFQDVLIRNQHRVKQLKQAGSTLLPYIFQVAENLMDNIHLKNQKWNLPVLTAIAEKYDYPESQNIKFFSYLGKIERSLGDYKKSERYYLRALEMAEASSEAPETLCYINCGISAVKRDLGYFDQGLTYIKKAIAIAEEHCKPDHAIFGTLYLNLGVIEKDLTNYPAARDAIGKAITIEEKLYGTDAAGLADLYGTLGMVERDLENYERAWDLINNALGIARKHYKKNDPRLSTFYSNMGLVEQDFFRYFEAKSWVQAALDIDKSFLEPDHPVLSSAYANIAMVNVQMGELNEAKTQMAHALEIEAKHYDDLHPYRANSYFMMASIEMELKNYDKAKEWLLKSIRINEAAYGPLHFRLLRDYSSLGVVEINRNKNYVDAKVWLTKALLVLAKNPEQPLANMAICYSNLGMIELEAQRFEEAKIWLIKAVRANLEKYKVGHPAHILTYSNLGIVAYNLNELPEAREWMHKAIEVAENFPEKERFKLATYHFTLGLIEGASGQLNEAKDCFLRTIVQNDQAFGPGCLENAFTYTQLALIDRQLGNSNAAKEWMERSIEMEEQLRGPDADEEMAISYTNLGLIELDLNHYLKAKKWLRRAIAVNEKLLDPLHYRLGLNYYYLGLAEFDTDDRQSGLKLLELAYHIFLKSLGKDDPTTQRCFSDLQKHLSQK